MGKVPKLKLGRKAARGDRRRPATPQLVPDKSEDRAESGRRIQGKQASDIEWATYAALRSLGWSAEDISFQLSVFGGRSMIGGGQVLDFVVSVGGSSVVIDVRGAAWHGPRAGKSARDRWREIQLQAQRDPPRLVIVHEDVAHDWQRLRRQLLKEVGAK